VSDRRHLRALAGAIGCGLVAATLQASTSAALAAASGAGAAATSRSAAHGATQGSPAALLARFKEVTGGPAWDRLRTLHTRGKVETGGLAGTFETWEELGTGRGTSRFQLGPLSGAEGFDGVAPWAQDPSGEVTIQRGEEALEAARNEAYRTTLAWWYPERWPAALRALGERREGRHHFSVVEITPRGGRPFELWMDLASGLPDRAVERGGVETVTTWLADWRTVETAPSGSPPVRLPFFARTSNGERKYDVVARAEAVDVDPPLAGDAFAPPSRRADDFALEGDAGSVEMPITLRSNHVYVDVELGGRSGAKLGPLPMLFDSGGFNVVTPEVASRLGLATEGALQARGVGEGSEELALTHVAEVRLAGATLRDQVFYVMALDGLTAVEGVTVAGVLGFEVLQRFVVEVDYARRRLTLTLPERFDPAAAGTPVPFVFAGHIPAVDGSVDGIAGRFTIDTGSRSALSLHRPFVEAHHLLERYHPEVEALTGWGVGGPVHAAVTRAGKLTLGAVEVPLPVTELVSSEKGALADRYLAGNVGGGVLRRFRVTFDYRRERLYLAPGGDAGADVFDRAGLWLVEHGEELVVEDTIPGGPAAAAGVMPGDRVEALDGVAVGELGPTNVVARLRHDPPGTSVRLRVRGSDARERDLDVELREVLAAPSLAPAEPASRPRDAQPATPTPTGQDTPVPPMPQ